jgi:hypothetical protein
MMAARTITCLVRGARDVNENRHPQTETASFDPKETVDLGPAVLSVHVASDGYTLLETVIALSVFVGVLIPLIMLAGDLMHGSNSREIHRALRMAETEMSMITTMRGYDDRTFMDNTGLTLEREVERRDNLVEATITVLGRERKILVVLAKSWMDYK